MNLWNTKKKDIPSDETREVNVKDVHHRIEWESVKETYGYTSRSVHEEVEFMPNRGEAVAYATALRAAFLFTRSKQIANQVKLYAVKDGVKEEIKF